MRSYFKVAVVFAALVAEAASAQVTARANVDRAYAALDPRTRTTVETYLRTDCEIGEVGVALKAVLAAGPTAHAYLVAVQQEGPPSPILDEFGRGLEGNWQAREA